MDDWEDIDENEGEDLEEEIIDYCAECNDPIHIGDIYHTLDDGQVICDDCFMTEYGECDICRKIYRIEDMERWSNNMLLCFDCTANLQAEINRKP